MRTFDPIVFSDTFAIHKIAKIAGYLFLFNLLMPTLGYVFVQSELFSLNDPILTSAQIMTNEKVFRLGVLSEFILSLGLIILGYSLYVILKSVNIFLSGIALFLKITEATLMATVSLLSFLALQIITGSEELLLDNKSLAGIILVNHGTLNSIPMLFLGVEMVIFNFLFYVSEMIPKWISATGIFAFILILTYSICSIVEPKWAFIVFTLPSFIYELIIGSWLIVKGVSFKDPQLQNIQ